MRDKVIEFHPAVVRAEEETALAGIKTALDAAFAVGGLPTAMEFLAQAVAYVTALDAEADKGDISEKLTRGVVARSLATSYLPRAIAQLQGAAKG